METLTLCSPSVAQNEKRPSPSVTAVSPLSRVTVAPEIRCPSGPTTVPLTRLTEVVAKDQASLSLLPARSDPLTVAR